MSLLYLFYHHSIEFKKLKLTPLVVILHIFSFPSLVCLFNISFLCSTKLSSFLIPFYYNFVHFI
eukprot:m.126584 g.126584  ORF g.126584 m.126584 type:complete len:64 (+) comp12996_c2_seq1:2665-2856(+)